MTFKEQRPRAAHPPIAMQAPLPKPIPPRQQHILVVDDDCTVLGSLAGVLTEEGFFVRLAINGDEAIAIASALPVDLVILDLNMPARDGWDTMKQLSTEHSLLPIIIATARPLQLFTALSAGVGALLEKPLDIPHLLETIRRLIAESSETRLRRLLGREAPFHYRPACGELQNSLINSANSEPGLSRSKNYNEDNAKLEKRNV
jgi:two-component system, NtrC family, nitrogen regulation response regulator NtrX